MMLLNFSSICNLLCLLVVHTVVVKMNKYSDENELTNFNENYFCEDVFDNKQCNYIRNVLRAIIDLYEMNNSKQNKNLFFAFGSQHVGITIGPKIGKITSDLIVGRKPNISLSEFSHDRF